MKVNPSSVNLDHYMNIPTTGAHRSQLNPLKEDTSEPIIESNTLPKNIKISSKYGKKNGQIRKYHQNNLSDNNQGNKNVDPRKNSHLVSSFRQPNLGVSSVVSRSVPNFEPPSLDYGHTRKPVEPQRLTIAQDTNLSNHKPAVSPTFTKHSSKFDDTEFLKFLPGHRRKYQLSNILSVSKDPLEHFTSISNPVSPRLNTFIPPSMFKNTNLADQATIDRMINHVKKEAEESEYAEIGEPHSLCNRTLPDPLSPSNINDTSSIVIENEQEYDNLKSQTQTEPAMTTEGDYSLTEENQDKLGEFMNNLPMINSGNYLGNNNVIKTNKISRTINNNCPLTNFNANSNFILTPKLAYLRRVHE